MAGGFARTATLLLLTFRLFLPSLLLLITILSMAATLLLLSTFQFFLFFVYSFVSSSYLSQGINALLDCEVPANFGVPTLRGPLFGSHRPIADRWTTAY